MKKPLYVQLDVSTHRQLGKFMRQYKIKTKAQVVAEALVFYIRAHDVESMEEFFGMLRGLTEEK